MSKINRNSLCPCGSEKKHKNCCMDLMEKEKHFAKNLLVYQFYETEGLFVVDFFYDYWPYQAVFNKKEVDMSLFPPGTKVDDVPLVALVTKDLMSGKGESVQVRHHFVREDDKGKVTFAVVAPDQDIEYYSINPKLSGDIHTKRCPFCKDKFSDDKYTLPGTCALSGERIIVSVFLQAVRQFV